MTSGSVGPQRIQRISISENSPADPHLSDPKYPRKIGYDPLQFFGRVRITFKPRGDIGPIR
jgi:hypothetical protein